MRSVMNVPNEGNCSVFWIKTLYKPGRGPRNLVTLAWAILQSAGKTVFRDLYRRPGRRSFHTKHHASPLHSSRISAFSQPNSSDTTLSPPRRPHWRLSPQEHCRSPARYNGQQENMADNIKCASCHLCMGEGHNGNMSAQHNERLDFNYWIMRMHAQPCLTLSNPMGCSSPGSSVQGIL